jgi:hypothetical protein
MSISINGNGSITGLSVGGLPDGSVDADSIAAGAVTDAKIGTGAVTNAKIGTGAVTDVKLGTGIDAAKLADGTVTSTELQYINSLSSNAQTQISGAGGMTSYVSSFSYDQSTTGSVAVTGVGFTPTLLIAHTVQASSPEGSTGFGNATTEHALRFDHNNSAEALSWANYIGQVLQSGSISCRWSIASFDADGFTYTKTKSGSATGTNKVMFLAMK